MKLIRRLLLLATLCIAGAAPGFGWGDEGHKIIADIAEAQLSATQPAVLAQLRTVFGPSFHLRDIAICADKIRIYTRAKDKFDQHPTGTPPKLDSGCATLIQVFAPTDTLVARYLHADKWHFIDIAVDGHQHAVNDAMTFCGPSSCAPAQIIKFRDQLSTNTTVARRAEAILFLTHLVGDVHQPLHAAERNDDGGGNNVTVTFFGSAITLHSLWDGAVIKHSGTDYRSLPPLAPGSADPWHWAVDANRDAVGVAYQDHQNPSQPIPEDGEQLPDAVYQAAAAPVVQRQLLLAGARLARLFTERLSTPPAPAPPPHVADEHAGVAPLAVRPGIHVNVGDFIPDALAKTSGCRANGALPDHDCTPGAIMAITQTEVCTTSTKGRRKVTSQMRDQVYASYGVRRPTPSGAYEVDHFIPLELGGSNDLANLWPEPASPAPGFHQKDCVENFLHAQVCTAKTMTLADAQRAIATDWLKVYNTQARDSHTSGCPGK